MSVPTATSFLAAEQMRDKTPQHCCSGEAAATFGFQAENNHKPVRRGGGAGQTGRDQSKGPWGL